MSKTKKKKRKSATQKYTGKKQVKGISGKEIEKRKKFALKQKRKIERNARRQERRELKAIKKSQTKFRPLVIIATYIEILMLVIIIWNILFMNTVVPSGSMENTIMPEDMIVCSRVFGSIKRGDIVVCRNPSEDSFIVKRVVAVGGDTVSFENGHLLVNGIAQNEDYALGKTYGGFITDMIGVPEGEYFLLGDNREDSTDSRYFDYPFIKRSDIVAKVGLRYYPLNKFGFIN